MNKPTIAAVAAEDNARVWPQGSGGPKLEGDAAVIDDMARMYNEELARMRGIERERLRALAAVDLDLAIAKARRRYRRALAEANRQRNRHFF